MANKIIRVDQDASIAWAFTFMGRNSLSINEINSYLDILKGILPENHVLFGVSNAVGFVLERYPSVFTLDNDIVYYFPNRDSARWFNVNKASVSLYKQAVDMLKIIEETTDEIKTVDDMILNRTM